LGASGPAVVPSPKDTRSPLVQPYWDRVVVGRHPPAQAEKLVPRLKEIFVAEGLPPEWVWIAEVESSMNPKARSPAGARGLFQFMPATAQRFGMSVSWPDERADPEKSARAAAKYLRFLHGEFGSWPLALAAYNAGEGRVCRTLKAADGASSFSAIARKLPAGHSTSQRSSRPWPGAVDRGSAALPAPSARARFYK
jgi:membrane-bound lytic murein transglycosylase D